MIRKTMVGICVPLALLTMSCGDNDSDYPVAFVHVLGSESDDLSVGLSLSPRVEVDHLNNTSEVVFPGTTVAVRRMIKGVNYIGVVVKGDSDRIEVLSARHPTESGAVMVVVDTSLDLKLEVLFADRNGSPKGNMERVSVLRFVKKGKHESKVSRETQ